MQGEIQLADEFAKELVTNKHITSVEVVLHDNDPALLIDCNVSTPQQAFVFGALVTAICDKVQFINSVES